MQMVYYTKKSPKREATGVPVYGCLTVNKQLGKHWNLGVDWHDMFDALNCRKVEENRHAANMSAVCYKYRYAVKPFLIVPIIGAMFADFINTGIITLFLNFL